MYKLTDNSLDFKGLFGDALNRALERVGSECEGIAKDLAPVDDGALRNSITHVVQNNAAYIGTNIEYGAYQELGTGKYYPGGRPTPWVYKDKHGDWHYTAGNRAQPYLKPAAANNVNRYQRIIEDELRGG